MSENKKKKSRKRRRHKVRKEDSRQETIAKGWKRIFQLPFEPIWFVPLMILTYVYSLIVIYETGHIDNSQHEHLTIWFIVDTLYAVDIFLVIGCKLIKSIPIPYITYTIRPTWILFLEVISIIPFELAINSDEFHKLFLFLRAIHSLKIFRVIYFFYYMQYMIEITFLYRCLSLLAVAQLVCVLCFSTHINIHCFYNECEDQRMEWLHLLGTINKLSSWSFSIEEHDIIFQITTISFGFITVFYAMHLLVAFTTNDLILATHHKFYFRHKIWQVKKEMEILGIPKYIGKPILEFYDRFWSKRQGYQDTQKIFRIIPDALQNEITLDVCCIALKHTKLFRDADVALMRYLSSLMKLKFLQAGELIYEKGEVKDKMIYVVSGTVQIISEQNGETPILSLSSGTCLGESSLIICNKSISTVRCKNYVEVQELHSSDFMRVAVMYPGRFRKIRKAILTRCKEAKKLHKMVQHFNRANKDEDYFTIIWIKSVMARINEQPQAMESAFLPGAEQETLDKMIFTAKYLDLLVLSDAIELDDETEFLKTTFPYIIHPNAIVLILWQFIICCLTILIMYVIPKYMFTDESTTNAMLPLLRITSYVWILDVIVQISTAVQTKESSLATVKEIFRYRLHTVSFFLDLIAAAPLEVFGCIIVTPTSGHNVISLRTNRLLKVWRIWELFRIWENRLHSNLNVIVYFKFSFVLLYLMYILSCILHASNCNYYPFDCFYDVGYNTFFSASQIVTGIGILGVNDEKYHNGIIYLLAVCVSCMFFIIMCIYFVSAMILQNTSLLNMEQLVIELERIMDTQKMKEKYSNRVFKYVDLQWQFNRGTKLLCNAAVTKDLPLDIFKFMTEAGFVSHLKKIKFFDKLGEAILFEICSILTYDILPPNEVVCYAGDMIDKLLIVAQGLCKIQINNTTRFLKEYEVVNPIVFVFKLPIMRTCVTKTHCLLLSMNYKKFMFILHKHPAHEIQYKKALQASLALRDSIKTNIQMDYSVHECKEEKQKSFHTFGYRLEKDSAAEYEYHVPFDKLFCIAVVKYLLMRLTFHSNGKFMYAWEILRSILAIFSCILHCVIISNWCIGCNWFYVRLACDLMAYIDIYIRMHVSYFNELGIEVTHPLRTAQHYVANGFIIDFLAVLPLEFILFQHSQIVNLILHSNRLLQMHRYIGLVTHFHTRSVKPKSFIYFFHYVPIILITTTFLGSVVLTFSCDIRSDLKPPENDKDLYTDGMLCRPHSWLLESEFKKPLDPYRAQLYSIYFVSTIMNAIGMGGYVIHRFFEGLLVFIFSMGGTYYCMNVFAKIILYSTSGSPILSMYRCHLKNFKNYMKVAKVNSTLQHKLIHHFELRWRRQRGQDVSNLMEQFHYTIKQDILYHIYGRTIFENSIFPPEATKLFRHIIVHAKHRTIVKGQKIFGVNDVRMNIYIVYKGFVNVLASDGTRLETVSVGSMFGNIDGRPNVRMTANFYAQDHVEVLLLRSTMFYEILRIFPNLMTIFRMTTERFVHYLPCRRSKLQDVVKDEVITSKGGLLSRFLIFINNKVFDPNSRGICFWKIINMLISCYLSIVLYQYQLALTEFNIFFVGTQYFCDLLFLVNYYIMDHLAFENKTGAIVTKLKLIQKRIREKRLRFYINTFSLIPLDCLAYLIPTNTRTKYMILKILRINRLLRVMNIREYFVESFLKLNIRTSLLQCTHLFIWLTLLLHTLTCILLGISVLYELNMSVHIETDLYDFPGQEKFKLYFAYYYCIFSCLIRSSQRTHYPEGSVLIGVFIIFMSVCPILMATAAGQMFIVVFNASYLKADFRTKIDQLYFFMLRENVSTQLVNKVRRYVNMVWLRHEGVLQPYLLEISTATLKETILCSSYGYHIENNVVFQNCHTDFKRQLCAKIKINNYYPGDYITFKNIINNSLYFIHLGEVEVVDEDDLSRETRVGTLKICNSFGLLQGVKLYTPHDYSYKAVRFCIILCLKFDEWKYLLDFFPASKENIYRKVEEYVKTSMNDISRAHNEERALETDFEFIY